MYARAFRNRKLGVVTVRPLANGDTETISALLERLGPESRARRFNGAKPRLSKSELARLASVRRGRHALVAYVEGDRAPAALAELVRDEEEWTHAEIAFAVADAYQGRCLGSTLVRMLVADARAAGVTHVTATVQSSNRAALAVIRKIASAVELRHERGEATLVAAVAPA